MPRDPWIDELNQRFPRRQPEPPYNPNRLYDWIIFLVLVFLILLIATACFGQTVSPVLVEGKGPHVKGEITVTNNQLIPMGLILEAQSVVVVSGQTFYQHLDPSINVKLGAMSARLSPKQSYVVPYEITCAAMPCVVNIGATFTGLHTKDGLAIALHLPHVVYVCQKARGCRDSVRHGWGLQ